MFQGNILALASDVDFASIDFRVQIQIPGRGREGRRGS